MPIVIILLLAALVAAFGFWGALKGILGAIGLIVLLCLLGVLTLSFLAAWLVNDDLIRRFAASVANISEGVSPRKQLEFLAPKSPFRAVERDDRIFVDPRSAERYDDLAETFASLRADGAAAVFLASDASSWITGAIIPMDGGNLAMNAGGSVGNEVFSE